MDMNAFIKTTIVMLFAGGFYANFYFLFVSLLAFNSFYELILWMKVW